MRKTKRFVPSIPLLIDNLVYTLLPVVLRQSLLLCNDLVLDSSPSAVTRRKIDRMKRQAAKGNIYLTGRLNSNSAEGIFYSRIKLLIDRGIRNLL